MGAPHECGQTTDAMHPGTNLLHNVLRPKSSFLSFATEASTQKENWARVCSSCTKNPAHDVYSTTLYVKPTIWWFLYSPIALPRNLIYWLSTTCKVLRPWLWEDSYELRCGHCFKELTICSRAGRGRRSSDEHSGSKMNHPQKNTIKEL